MEGSPEEGAVTLEALLKLSDQLSGAEAFRRRLLCHTLHLHDHEGCIAVELESTDDGGVARWPRTFARLTYRKPLTSSRNEGVARLARGGRKPCWRRVHRATPVGAHLPHSRC